MTSVPQLGEIIKKVLQEAADQAGKTTGFIKRVREFTGASFAQTMILGQMQPGEVSLSDLSQFARHMKVNVSPQAIDQRLNEKTVSFFEEILNAAFTQVVAADPVAIPLLKRFSEVIVEDSSTFSLPDILKDLWEGCGGKTFGTLSAFKVHVRWDLLNGALTNIALGPGKLPDNKSPFKMNRRQRRSVRIADLGYFDTLVFEQEHAAGEYWISRVKVGNLLIFDEEGNRLDLPTFLAEHAVDHSYECFVQVSATRRLRARLIAFPVPEDVAVKRQADNARKAQRHSRKVNPTLQELAHWTLLITNIPSALLSAQEALILLRARWQIELLYKLWKQYAQADTSRSEKPYHLLCDIYAKLIGMIIVHWLMIVGCWHIPNRSMVKAAKAIRHQVNLLARALNGRDDLNQVLQEITEGLDRCCQNNRNKHPNTSQLLSDPSSSYKRSSPVSSETGRSQPEVVGVT
ncbi:MAG: IS4 family transposase [Chloroflexi bacterium]|nr:MAG: IS4 family transposase [Chloroflexota bacterium]